MRTTLISYEKQIAETNAELNQLGINIQIELDDTSTSEWGMTSINLFDYLIPEGPVAEASRELYVDGHYQEAVNRAFIRMEGLVRHKSASTLSGVSLMRAAFSANAPILKLNKGKSQSEKDEQQGYMELFAGAMAGIRNPRSHDHSFMDSAESALELLLLAHHLCKRVDQSVKSRKRK